jgi:hypothetical protein
MFSNGGDDDRGLRRGERAPERGGEEDLQTQNLMRIIQGGQHHGLIVQEEASFSMRSSIKRSCAHCSCLSKGIPSLMSNTALLIALVGHF